MDEEKKSESEKGGEPEAQHQHVHIFGAEVNASGDGKAGIGTTDGTTDSKEDWKAKHREQREQWKARRQEWRQDHRHGGSLFFGLVVLLVGVLALLYTMGFVSRVFWHAIVPFWPILVILWGASIVLGRHWFARFIIFLLALAFLIAVILYGLVRSDSPVVSSLSPNVVSAIQNTNPR